MLPVSAEEIETVKIMVQLSTATTECGLHTTAWSAGKVTGCSLFFLYVPLNWELCRDDYDLSFSPQVQHLWEDSLRPEAAVYEDECFVPPQTFLQTGTVAIKWTRFWYDIWYAMNQGSSSAFLQLRLTCSIIQTAQPQPYIHDPKNHLFPLFISSPDPTASREKGCDFMPQDLPVGKWPCEALVVESDSFCVSHHSHNNSHKPQALPGKSQIVRSFGASGPKYKHQCWLQEKKQTPEPSLPPTMKVKKDVAFFFFLSVAGGNKQLKVTRGI